MRMRAWLAAAVVVAASHGALAGPDRATQAKADALFEKGGARYDAGDYAAAIPMFEDAYALVHDPVYLFNIAQSYRKSFDCEKAADYYKRYLAESPNPPNRSKVEQWLHELEPCVTQRTQEREHAAAAEADAKARTDAAAAAAAAAQPRPVPAAPAPTAAERDGGARYRAAGIATSGAGLVLLAVAGGFAHHGSTLEDEVAHACSAGCAWNVESSTDQAGKRANTIAELTVIGGGAAVIGGAALYFLGRSRSGEHVTLEPTRGGGVVSARLRF